MVTHTISIPELIFTLLAFLGVIANGRVTWRATVELVGLRVLKINSIREYAAITTLAMFSSFTIVQVLLLIIGIDLMTLSNIRPITFQSVILSIIFCLMEILLVGVATTVEYRRRILAKKIREIEYMGD